MLETKQIKLILIDIDCLLLFFFFNLILTAGKLGVIPDHWPK